jgi:hypothetical protein
MDLTDLCDIVGYRYGKVGEGEIQPYYSFSERSDDQSRLQRAFIRGDFSRFIWDVFKMNTELGRRLLGAKGIGLVMRGGIPDVSISDAPVNDISGVYRAQDEEQKEGEQIVIVKQDDQFCIEGEEWTGIGRMLGLNVVKSYFHNAQDGFYLLIARKEEMPKGSKIERIYINGIYIERDGKTGKVSWKMVPKEDAA